MKIAPGILAATIITASGIIFPMLGFAAAPPGNVMAELDALKARVNQQDEKIRQQDEKLRQYETNNEENWMNARRAQEIRGIVRDAMADAATRPSLQNGPVSAGYDKGFFIKSANNDFSLNVNGTFQFRYVAVSRRDDNYSQTVRTAVPGSNPGDPAITRATTTFNDDFEGGFTFRRIQINFQGNAFGPNWNYRVRLAADADGRAARVDVAYLSYQINPNWQVMVGQFKQPFLREALVGDDRQLAIERSYVTDYFSVDYSQGVQVSYWKDRFAFAASVHDGSYSHRTEFDNDRSSVAFAARAEYVLAGDEKMYTSRGWSQLKDFSGFNGDKFTVLLGAAIDYEMGESGGLVTQTNSSTATIAGIYPDILKFSVDVSIEGDGWNAFVALVGQSLEDNGQAVIVSGTDIVQAAQQWGLVVQGGYFIVPNELEIFARYEWLDFDGTYYRNDGGSVQTWVTGSALPALIPANNLSIITVGFNRYLHKQNVKVTADVMYIFDPVPVSNRGGGVLATSKGDEIVGRVQLLFGF